MLEESVKISFTDIINKLFNEDIIKSINKNKKLSLSKIFTDYPDQSKADMFVQFMYTEEYITDLYDLLIDKIPISDLLEKNVTKSIDLKLDCSMKKSKTMRTARTADFTAMSIGDMFGAAN